MRLQKTSGLACALLLLCLSGVAEAKPVRYAGTHPRTGKPHGGLCFIEAVHVHPLAPANEALYRLHAGVLVFIGDPAPFGYEGEKHPYYGHHPVVVRLEEEPEAVEYCYLDGPHFHIYEPPSGHRFVEKEHVHYYAGEYPPEYERQRPKYAVINTVYRPIEYVRPVVVELPPPEYHGPIIDVRIAVPVPTLDVRLGLGAVQVGHPHSVFLVGDGDDHHHHKRGKGHYKGKRRHGDKDKDD